MSSLYDLVTVILFAGLAVLYLQRSASQQPKDRILHYAPAALGCAVADWLGNNHMDIPAMVTIGGVIAYSLWVLKPFARAE